MEQRENLGTNNCPDAAWPIWKVFVAMPVLSAGMPISALRTTPLQTTYYSKTKWVGLSRKNKPAAEANPTPQHCKLLTSHWNSFSESGFIQILPLPLCSWLASAEGTQVVRGLHVLQQMAEMLFSPFAHHPKSTLAHYLGLFISLLPVIGYYQSWNYFLPK